MPVNFITIADFNALLAAESSHDNGIIKCAASTENTYLTYKPHNPGDTFEYTGFRPTETLKGLLFPPREKVAEYPAGSPEALTPAPPPMVVGAAACDLQSLATLDAVFLEEEFIDPFYAARRGKLFVITQDCTQPRPSCACTYLGFKPYPEKGYDLNLSRIGGGYVVETGSEKGFALVEKHKSRFSGATPPQLSERDRNRQEAVLAVEEINREYELKTSRREVIQKPGTEPQWEENTKTCVECAACLFSCPTCHCFLLYDQKAGRVNQRLKSWDACSYAGYGRMAGGGTPRPYLVERFRHRYEHKFNNFVERFGFEMCSGCGRCIEACAGKIDMRKVFKSLENGG